MTDKERNDAAKELRERMRQNALDREAHARLGIFIAVAWMAFLPLMLLISVVRKWLLGE